MSALSEYVNMEELLTMVRLYAHQLLMGYEDTHEEDFWLISEKMAELYEFLLSFIPKQQPETKETAFPENYWLLCQKNYLESR